MPQVYSLGELLEQQLGVNTRPVVTEASIGVAAEQVIPNNANRVALTMVNLSANTIYIMIDNGVAATRGLRLGANGGTISLNWKDDLHLILWEWHAIATAANSDLLVLEEIII